MILTEIISRINFNFGKFSLTCSESIISLLYHSLTFFHAFCVSLNFSHFAGLIFVIQLPRGLAPLLVTGNSADVAKLFRRYLSTVVHTKYWYESDPFDPKSSAFKSLKQVRGMHSRVCKMMNEKHKRDEDNGRIWVSQLDMAYTQFAFIGFFLLYPQQCGMHKATDEMLDCLNYFWRVMGHCLAIEDRFNLCAGDLEESRSLYRLVFEKDWKPIIAADKPPAPVGIEMGKGIVLAMKKVSPTLNWEANTKYWFEVLDIPREIELTSFKSKVLYGYLQFTMNCSLRCGAGHWFASFMTKRRINKAVTQKRKKEKLCKKKHGHLKYEEEGGCPFGNIDIDYEDAFDIDPKFKPKTCPNNNIKQ